MKIFCSLIFVITLGNASKLHLTPLILTTLQQQLPNPEQQPARQQYHNQDSKGFYSYGYRGETSAKAEYKSVDGNAKGFYAYVDTNGKLQKVEYVAGSQHGFQATATNLPKAPVDDRRGPVQVKDTTEVQMAKKAHFEAYRAAEMRAALISNEKQTNDDDNNSGEMNEENLIKEQQKAQEQEQEQRNMLQTNEHEQQKLMLMMANMHGKDNLMGMHEQMDNGSQEHNIDLNLNEEAAAEVSDERDAAQLMTTYRLSNIADGPELSNSLQSYSLAQPGSSKALTTHTRTLAYLPLANTNAALHSTHLGSVLLPLPTYYSSITPATSYTLAPTVLTTLPRLQSSSTITTTHGHILPQRILTH